MDTSIQWYILFSLIGLVIFVLVLRWIFSIDRHLKNQRAMIALLMKLCKQQGVSIDDLNGIKNTFELK